MKISIMSVVAGLGLLGLACGGAPEPRERLATAQASIRAAKEIGADNVPQAQLHAQLAQEQVTLANKLIEEGENERADYVLRRAAADAELAVALTREATTQKQAEATEAAVAPKPGASTEPMQAQNQ